MVRFVARVRMIAPSSPARVRWPSTRTLGSRNSKMKRYSEVHDTVVGCLYHLCLILKLAFRSAKVAVGFASRFLPSRWTAAIVPRVKP